MRAATVPAQRPSEAKLLAVDRCGRLREMLRSHFVELLRAGDLVIANDAATLPASLHGVHARTASAIEIRLTGRPSIHEDETREFSAVVFGDGDFRTRTEDRPRPPELSAGDRLALGPLQASVVRMLGHPRRITLRFDGPAREVREGLSRHGRPIQYTHVSKPLELWDTWTPIAGVPASFEPPSASFLLDWAFLRAVRGKGVRFGTLTHAAGISSTGDPALDALLPFEEAYRIPGSTARLIEQVREEGGRLVAIGTTVTRALEDAAESGGTVRAGEGVAARKIGSSTRLRVVDAIVSGVHEAGSSHHDLLKAFAEEETIRAVDAALETGGYRTHEFGDSVFVERASIAGNKGGEFPLTRFLFEEGAVVQG